MDKLYSITPLHESAALVSFGNVIDASVNRKVISLHHILKKKPFKGFVEAVPAYSSLAVYFNSFEVMQGNLNKRAFDFVEAYLENALVQLPPSKEEEINPVVEVPVLYNGDDLLFVADQHQLTTDEVVSIHTSMTYQVFMIGFLPGFPYMGTVDQRIASPRKSSPRTAVPSGSVGIAGYQTGIYPQVSPGGWQLIGRTPLKIFAKERSNPCLFSPGDRVRFYPVSLTEFEKLNEY